MLKQPVANPAEEFVRSGNPERRRGRGKVASLKKTQTQKEINLPKKQG